MYTVLDTYAEKTHIAAPAHLPCSSQKAWVTSQSQAKCTHNAGLARSIGTKNHIQSRGRTDSDIIKSPALKGMCVYGSLCVI